jgi:ABC-type transport system involved in cytochrome bd biosynthesis fused ATPase/permease subunit
MSTTAGKSLLYVTHRLDELAAFDEVDVIENGRVVSRCVPEESRDASAVPGAAGEGAATAVKRS